MDLRAIRSQTNCVKIQKKYGLLGKSLQHSFSKEYFENKFNKLQAHQTYDLIELPSAEDVETWIRAKSLDGFNVTVPYKKVIMPFLDELDASAEKAGAVNTVMLKHNRYVGYNTDVYGFLKLTGELPHPIERALILGTGGASRAVQWVLTQQRLPFLLVSRSSENDYTLPYSELLNMDFGLFNTIINTTPLGMYPDVDSYPNIPYEKLNDRHMLIDLIYNRQRHPS